MPTAIGTATQPARVRTLMQAVAKAAASTAWFEGHDQSPAAGHAITVARSAAVHGRGSATRTLIPSLSTYAAMTPAPALTSVQNRRPHRKKAQTATAATRITSANSPLLATKSILPTGPAPSAQCAALMYTSSRTE